MRAPRAAFACLALAFGTLVTATPATSAPPEVAAIEATAPLDDPSEESVKAALTVAVQRVARGALAMGLPWLRIERAYVRQDHVGVQATAMKTQPSEDDDAATMPPDQESAPAPERGDGETPTLRL